MKNIKIITVVLGEGGFLATKFNEETGELILWPNDAAIELPEDANKYLLSGDATKWSMFDSDEVHKATVYDTHPKSS